MWGQQPIPENNNGACTRSVFKSNEDISLPCKPLGFYKTKAACFSKKCVNHNRIIIVYPWRAVSFPERLDFISPIGSMGGVTPVFFRLLIWGQHLANVSIGSNSAGSKPPKFLRILCSRWFLVNFPSAFAKFTTIFIRLKSKSIHL